MKITKVHFKGLGAVGEIDIDFSTDPQKPLTVIRAEPGSGKTTIAKGMEWILWGYRNLGEPDYRLHDTREEDSPKTITVLGELYFEHTFNEEDGVSETKEYKVRREVTVEIKDRESWTIQSETIFVDSINITGLQPVPNPQMLINSICHIQSSKVVFTDGDNLQHFITDTDNEGRKMVSRAVEEMLNIQMLEEVQKRVNSARLEFQGELKGLNTPDVDEKRDNLNKLEEELAANQVELDGLYETTMYYKSSLETVEKHLQALQTIGNEDTLKQNLMKAENTIKENESELVKTTEAISQLFTQNQSFGRHYLTSFIEKSASRLNDLYEAGALPRYSVPVLNSVLEDNICICGEPLPKNDPDCHHRKKIIEHVEEGKNNSAADGRLTDLRILANTTIKSQGNYLTESKARIKELFTKRKMLITNTNDARHNKKEAETKISELAESKLTLYIDQKAVLQSDLAAGNQKIGSLEQENKMKSQQIQLLNIELEKIDHQQAQYDNKISNQYAADDVFQVVRALRDSLVKEEIVEISKLMNQIFMNCIGNEEDSEEALISRTRISNDFEIEVLSPNGTKHALPSGINGASRRALTVAFVLALSTVSGSKPPILIDTPVSMMGIGVKQRTLQQIVKHATQPILFLTRSDCKDIEDILDKTTGKFTTLVNTKQGVVNLVNLPETDKTVLQCVCSHRQYCDDCEHVGDEGTLSHRTKN